MPLPNIPRGMSIPERPKSEKPKEPERPKSLFDREPFLHPDRFKSILRNDPDFFNKIAGSSPSEAEKIINKLSELFPLSGGSITRERAQRIAKELDHKIQFSTDPNERKMSEKIRETLRNYFGV